MSCPRKFSFTAFNSRGRQVWLRGCWQRPDARDAETAGALLRARLADLAMAPRIRLFVARGTAYPLRVCARGACDECGAAHATPCMRWPPVDPLLNDETSCGK
eukprot:2185724-Pleurochrysis_carterae.AAC.1